MKTDIENLEYRMYGLVPYNLSDIQKGIQFQHAVTEYMVEHDNQYNDKRKTPLGKWSRLDKTSIILNGGTTNDSAKDGLPIGDLNRHEITLLSKAPSTSISVFTEPDLGNQLTAIVFLVDERVWNKKKYPDFNVDTKSLSSPPILSGLDKQIKQWKSKFSSDENIQDEIVFLRSFLTQFKLA